MTNQKILARCENFLRDTGATVSAFCRNAQISRTYFYNLKNDLPVVSEVTLRRIAEYLERFGY